MPKINHEEYEVLKGLDDKWKWIAMDRDSYYAEIYQVRPYKTGPVWFWDGHTEIEEIKNENLFQFIQWEDESPYNIAELIEEYEIKELRIAPAGTIVIDSESEETEVTKDIEWFIEKMDSMHRMRDPDRNPDEWFISKTELLEALNQLDEPEVLSQKWINNHIDKFVMRDGTRFVSTEYLQNLLVPKQEEAEAKRALSEWENVIKKDFERLNKLEIQIKNLTNLSLEEIRDKARSGYAVIEKPTIPQFVADWIEEMKQEERPLYSVMSTLMNKTNHKWSVWKNANKNFSEIIAQAWLAYPNIEIEEEPKYYAKIKGWENVTTGSERFNWVYFKEKDTVGVSKAIENKYQAVSFTKNEWENLGINDDNADFVEVEELEK